ncbi:unnamed protein product [Nesidiocoris tenuis]|uniref:Reverse transcriptase zinc-binding domain-containing protein n=1 Tax=Nesidiocoris tenuis TaxID=355587 RepID=A0A6H5G0E0_9HEMI|nr:unnamed protein product [Nesidiocoris tenuis]
MYRRSVVIKLNNARNCAEFWGAIRFFRSSTGEVQNKRTHFKILSHSQICSYVRLEAGILPLSYHTIKSSLHWLRKVVVMPPERYPRVCLERLIRLSRSPFCELKFNWMAQLRSKLTPSGSDFISGVVPGVNLNPDIAIAMSRLEAWMATCDLRSVMSSSFSVHYKHVHNGTLLGPQKYLVHNWPLHNSRTLAQLRVLGRNYGRIGGQLIRLSSTELCPICGCRAMDDLSHFLLECPMLVDPRLKFLRPLFESPLTGTAQLIRLLASEDRAVTNRLYFFLLEAVEVRDLITSV